MSLHHMALVLALVATPALAQRVGPGSAVFPDIMSAPAPMTGAADAAASNPLAPRPVQAAPATADRPAILPGATVHRGSNGEEVVVNPPVALDTGLGGPMRMSTPDVLEAESAQRARALAEARRAQAPGAVPQTQVPPAAQGGCAAGGSLEQLLSPGCLDVLRTLRPGSPAPTGPFGLGAPPVPVPQQQSVSCTVAVHAIGQPGVLTNGSMASFQVPTLQHCLMIGTRLSFGIPSLTNITAVDPAYGFVAVTCQRGAADPTAVACAAQPAR